MASRVDSLGSIHADVGRETRRLSVLHADRLQCQKGCNACCVDDLSVFPLEAEHIRGHHAALLAGGVPHPPGACAFLDASGACRIYAERPYVCRTQGLPLRWIEESVARAGEPHGDPVELRDICPLNDAGPPIEEMDVEACWSVGPVEERLARLQVAADPRAPRMRLRDLFAATPGAPPLETPCPPETER
jgi:hypothetical protein